MARDLWERPANTLHGVAAKLRVLRYHTSSMSEDEYVQCVDTCLEMLARVQDADGRLFALEVEMKAAHEGYATPKSDEDYWYARMTAAEKATLAISAQTTSDVAAKLRIIAYYQDPPRDDDSVFDNCIRHVIEDAARIGGAS